MNLFKKLFGRFKELVREKIEKPVETGNTQYRIVNDGYFDYLQYKKGNKWLYVLDCQFYQDELRDYIDYNRYVSTGNRNNLEIFVKRYPRVEEWYVRRGQMLNEAHNRRMKKEKEREAKRSKVKYL